jgi:hypothetical protein
VAIPVKSSDYWCFLWFPVTFVVFTDGYLCSSATSVVYGGPYKWFCGVAVLDIAENSGRWCLKQQGRPSLVAVGSSPYPE